MATTMMTKTPTTESTARTANRSTKIPRKVDRLSPGLWVRNPADAPLCAVMPEVPPGILGVRVPPLVKVGMVLGTTLAMLVWLLPSSDAR